MNEIQYIWIVPDQDFWIPIKKELKENYTIFNKVISNPLLKFINKVHNSMRINNFVRLPFKSIWYKHYLDLSTFRDDITTVCIFIEGINLAYDVKYLAFLQNKFKKIYLVYYLVNTVPVQKKNCVPNIKFLKSHYNLIYSFDEDDSKSYDLLHFSGLYSNIKEKMNRDIKSDLFFVGKNKNRIDMIHKIYVKMKKNRIKCDFYITDVPKKQQIFKDEISYNKRLSYNEVIEKIESTKCILGIIYNDRNNCTLRTREAVIFDRKLLTNNFNVLKYDFYDPKYISVYDNIDRIDLDFIQSEIFPKFDQFKNSFSPIIFQNHIKKNLLGQIIVD